MDSVTVKAMENKRAKTEVCPLLLVCQDTGAVYTQVAYNYSMSALLVQWKHFVAKRGRPTKVVSDRGSQLTSANSIAILNWGRIEEQGMVWEYITIGNQWTNKLTELRVKTFKETLAQMFAKTLSYKELVTFLTKAANAVNNRPVALRSPTHGDLVPRTVNQLLSERASGAALGPQAA